VLATLLHALRHDTPRCRAAAAGALGHLDEAAATEALRTALNDDDPWVRYFAATSLGRQRATEGLDALVDVATNDSAGHVRIAAIEGIGAIGGPRALACLEPLTTAADTDVAAAAMRAIGEVQVPSVAGVLREGLRSPDPALRVAAAQGLAAHGGAEAVESLRWTASADEDRSVVTAALAALRVLASRPESTGDAVRAIAAVASDPTRRPIALPTLAKIPQAAVPALGSVLRSPETAVRTVVVDALAFCFFSRGPFPPDRRGCCRGGLELLGHFAQRGIEPRVPPQLVDRLESSGRDQPRARVLRHAFARPRVERRRERVVHRFLGPIEIAEQPNQRGQHAARIGSVDCPDLVARACRFLVSTGQSGSPSSRTPRSAGPRRIPSWPPGSYPRPGSRR